MRVKFNKSVKYEQNDPAESKAYNEGETHDLPDDHAQRWIRRGVAVEVDAAKPAKTLIKSEPTKVESTKVESSKVEKLPSDKS